MYKPGSATGTLALIAAAALLAGCSAISTTTRGVKNSFISTSDGISSSSDTATGAAKSNQQAVAFVRSQLPAIREDAARGAGQNATTLAWLLHRKHPATFARWMQGHYQSLFTNLDQPKELLARIDSLQRQSHRN